MEKKLYDVLAIIGDNEDREFLVTAISEGDAMSKVRQFKPNRDVTFLVVSELEPKGEFHYFPFGVTIL